MTLPKFANEKCIDFTKPANRKKQHEAIVKVRAGLGREYPILIGSERIVLEEKFSSYNPSRSSEVIGVFQKGNATTANRAVEVALARFEDYSARRVGHGHVQPGAPRGEAGRKLVTGQRGHLELGAERAFLQLQTLQRQAGRAFADLVGHASLGGVEVRLVRGDLQLAAPVGQDLQHERVAADEEVLVERLPRRQVAGHERNHHTALGLGHVTALARGS